MWRFVPETAVRKTAAAMAGGGSSLARRLCAAYRSRLLGIPVFAGNDSLCDRSRSRFAAQSAGVRLAPAERAAKELFLDAQVWRSSSACFSTGLNRDVERKCWSCGAVAPSGFFTLCAACKVVQPSDPSVNYFDIFSLEKDFELDPIVLEKRYKDLQKKLHPDLFGMKSQKEQHYSADQSSQVINAYQVLLKPLSRATYLLETFGVHVEDEGTIDDPEILMEVMEVQEAVSECSDANKLREMQEKARSRMRDYEKLFIQAMKKHDLGAAKEAVQRMSYFHRIINNITQKL